MTKPQIFKTLTNPDRPLIAGAIPSLGDLIRRRATTAEKAQGVYESLWLNAAAAWSEDEQRDFALGYFMATHSSGAPELLPPNVGAFTQNRGEHLPTKRRRLAYKAGAAFAEGKGSSEALGIRGRAFGFAMKPRQQAEGALHPDLAAIGKAAAAVSAKAAFHRTR